jgi:hypothetical protein
VSPASHARRTSESAPPASPAPDPAAPSRDELRAVQRRLEAVRDELHETRALAVARESRCHQLEQAAQRERRAAEAAQEARDGLARSHAVAIGDRDNALAQLAEAVEAREVAARERSWLEAQLDEALAQLDDALVERDAALGRSDELLLEHLALQEQLAGEWAAQSAQPDEPPERVAVPDAPPVAPVHLHRDQVNYATTPFDVWVTRVLSSGAAFAFVLLFVMFLKTLFDV